MANDNNGTGGIGKLDQSLTSIPAAAKKDKSAVDKTDFLNLLVTQLKHQDPLEPMKNEEFAVQLAQFSQLEQLISINQKVGGGQQADLSSLASYLGHEVSISSDKIAVKGQDGGQLKLDLVQDAREVEVEVLGSDGAVKQSLKLGPLTAGKHIVALKGIDVANGEYQFQVKATSTHGGEFKPDVKVAGIVSGFVPGPEPKLLIGSREVDPSEVTEVSLPSTQG